MDEIQMARLRPARRSRSVPSLALLSAHEIALLRAMAAGNTNVQLGVLVNRSEKTVRNQLTRLYVKLRARNRAEAVAIYMRMGEI
jgi:DNA-binding CsgD family transcriptional regulator